MHHACTHARARKCVSRVCELLPLTDHGGRLIEASSASLPGPRWPKQRMGVTTLGRCALAHAHRPHCATRGRTKQGSNGEEARHDGVLQRALTAAARARVSAAQRTRGVAPETWETRLSACCRRRPPRPRPFRQCTCSSARPPPARSGADAQPSVSAHACDCGAPLPPAWPAHAAPERRDGAAVTNRARRAMLWCALQGRSRTRRPGHQHRSRSTSTPGQSRRRARSSRWSPAAARASLKLRRTVNAKGTMCNFRRRGVCSWLLRAPALST